MSHLPALGHKRKVVLNRPSSSKPCTLSQLDMPPKRKPLTTVVIDMPIEDRMATLHVTMLEKKMEQLTVDDVETVWYSLNMMERHITANRQRVNSSYALVPNQLVHILAAGTVAKIAFK